MPLQLPKSENADKNPKLDRYEAADNAYNSRYKKARHSYALVRKMGTLVAPILRRGHKNKHRET